MLFWKLHHCSAFLSPGKKKYVSFAKFSCDLPPKPPCRKTTLSAQHAFAGQVYSSAEMGFWFVQQEQLLNGPRALHRDLRGLGRDSGHSRELNWTPGLGNNDHITPHTYTLQYLSSPVCCICCSGSYLLSSVYHHSKINSLRQNCISLSCLNTARLEILYVSKYKRCLSLEAAQNE